MRKREEGAIHLFSILLVVIVIVLVLSAVAYYTLMGKTPFYQSAYPTLSPAASPVSESDDTKTIENEINGTQEQSIDSDLYQLDSSASSL